MSDNETPPTSPSELSRLIDETAGVRREVAGAKQALGRLADALMGVHSVTSRTARKVESTKETGERIEQKVGTLGERLAVALAKLEDVEEAVDDVEREVTGKHDLPPPDAKRDPTIEEHVRVAKSWAGSLWRHRDIVLAIIVLISMGFHALTLLAAHAR